MIDRYWVMGKSEEVRCEHRRPEERRRTWSVRRATRAEKRSRWPLITCTSGDEGESCCLGFAGHPVLHAELVQLFLDGKGILPGKAGEAEVSGPSGWPPPCPSGSGSRGSPGPGSPGSRRLLFLGGDELPLGGEVDAVVAGEAVGGQLTSMLTSLAPASRRLIRERVVVPRMMESSTITTRLPLRRSRTGLSLIRTEKSRMVWEGWMKVRPT